MIGELIQNCYTYECANSCYYYMFITLTNISHKLEKLEANELSHHSHQLLQPSGQNAVLQSQGPSSILRHGFALYTQHSLLTNVLFTYVLTVVWYGIVWNGMVYSGRKLLVSFSGQLRKAHPYLAIPNGLVIAHHQFILKKSLLSDMTDYRIWQLVYQSDSYLYKQSVLGSQDYKKGILPV